MRRALATVVLLILWEGDALASGPAKLSCEPKAGENSSVSLKGLVPDTEEELDITLSDGTVSIRMTYEDADEHQVQALEYGVYSIIINRRNVSGQVTLYAIPKTVKVNKRSGYRHATFDAVMKAPNPQHQGPVRSASDMVRGLKLSCSYDYSL